MKPSTAATLFLIFEAMACVWVLNFHLPGLLLTPLPMPVWQRIALVVAMVAAVLPLAIRLVGHQASGALARGYATLAVILGLGLWVALLGVHQLEVPPLALPRIWGAVALLAPFVVIPIAFLRRPAGSGDKHVRHRLLFGWWLLMGSYALAEAVVGEFVRVKDWGIMGVESSTYASMVNDARGFRVAPNAKWFQRYSSDPDGYFGVDRTIEYQANSRGLREREIPLEKPAGTFRILALGDSFTLGGGVHADDTWPRQLERLLRQRMPGRPVEVINAGVIAYDTRQELEHYRRNVKDYHPDLVILAMVWNDAEPGNAGMFSASFLGSTRALSQYLPLTDRMARAVATFCGYTGVHTFPDDWRNSFAALLELKDETVSSGVGLLVVIYPSVQPLHNEALQKVYHMQQEFCEEHGIDVLNTWPAFAARSPQQWQVHPADNHPNAGAHALFAEQVAERVAPILTTRSTDGTP